MVASAEDSTVCRAFRVPEMIRWPGRIPAGMISNEIISHHDWLPTFLAAAGDPDIVEKLKAGHQIGSTTYKVHIDGYNLLPHLTGEAGSWPRPGRALGHACAPGRQRSGS
jgi:arylsulfatase A-like enzyme